MGLGVHKEAGGIIPDIVGEGLFTRYPFMLSLGVAAGLLWIILTSSRPPTSDPPHPGSFSPAQGISAGLVALTGGLLGARLTFVLVHSGYYMSRPFEFFALWQGGLAWSGAAAGAVLGLLLYSRRSRAPFWGIADLLAIPALLVAAAAWIGCYLDGCAYGVPVEHAWWAILSLNWIGEIAPRWPTQLVGSLLCLLVVAALIRIQSGRPWAGAASCLSLASIAAISTALSLTRGDPIWLVFGVRLDTLSSIAVLLPSLGFFIRHAYQDRLGRNRCLASP